MIKTGENQIITPNHILNGAGVQQGTQLSGAFTEDVLEHVKRARRELPSQFEELKERRNKFWKALQEQYLESLRFTRDNMSNKFTRQPKVGDVCIIYSEDPRRKWRMAIILRKIQSQDGECRQCEIKTAHGVTTRAINHLYPLELQVEEDAEQEMVEVQQFRANKHKTKLVELKGKMKSEAKKDKNLNQEELNTILEKIDENEGDRVAKLNSRPRRKAALNFLERNKQMVADNAI